MKKYTYEIAEDFEVGKKVYRKRDLHNDLTWLKFYTIKGHVVLKDNLDKTDILIVLSVDGNDVWTAKIDELWTVKETKELIKQKFNDDYEKIFKGVD